jgi:hypothetical protein
VTDGGVYEGLSGCFSWLNAAAVALCAFPNACEDQLKYWGLALAIEFNLLRQRLNFFEFYICFPIISLIRAAKKQKKDAIRLTLSCMLVFSHVLH